MEQPKQRETERPDDVQRLAATWKAQLHYILIGIGDQYRNYGTRDDMKNTIELETGWLIEHIAKVSYEQGIARGQARTAGNA